MIHPKKTKSFQPEQIIFQHRTTIPSARTNVPLTKTNIPSTKAKNISTITNNQNSKRKRLNRQCCRNRRFLVRDFFQSYFISKFSSIFQLAISQICCQKTSYSL